MESHCEVGGDADVRPIAALLSRVHVTSPLAGHVGHRCRVCYSLPLDPTTRVGTRDVHAAAQVVSSWAQCHSAMGVGFWREVTVRQSRSGAMHLKLILQAEDLHDDPCKALESMHGWEGERDQFVAFVRKQLPALDGVSAQVATSRSRPSKVAPCVLLYGNLHLLESHCGWSYGVGPETFSQVNHATAEMLVARVAWWLGLGEEPAAIERDTPCPRAARSAAAASTVACASAQSILVSGRDINLFGAALFGATEHTLHVVTHCPNAHADALVNLRARFRVDGRTHLRLLAKGAQTAAHVRLLASSASPPEVAVVTAGRRGVGSVVAEALRTSRSLRAIVYVACCEETLLADLEWLLGGGGGFAVADAARYDHFPGSGGSGLVGSALLLLPRPRRVLILPVGPACSGKSSLCERLARLLPRGALAIAERDRVLARHRASGLGLARSKSQTHGECVSALREIIDAGRVGVYDSCNAAHGGRAHIEALLGAELVVILSFQPDASIQEGLTSGDDGYRAMLAARATARQGHPTFPHAPDEQGAALDATISAMEWPAAVAADGKDVSAQSGAARRRVLVRALPDAPRAHGDALLSVAAALFWRIDDSNAHWSHLARPLQSHEPKVFLTIRKTIGDDAANGTVQLAIQQFG
jgi:predicted kinase